MTTPRPLHHFYHCYADGDWRTPVSEHFSALMRSGLFRELETVQVGLVGNEQNVGDVREWLDGYDCHEAAVVAEGYEQVTLDALYEFSQTHDGDVLYAHTKGAANFAAINDQWRRSMTQKCVMEWRTAVEALAAGKSIVGCHWIKGQPDIERLSEAWRNRELNPPGLDGVGGMFGGNYWWTKLELLRHNCPPDHVHRHAAEHWLGQLSEVMPINADTILDMLPVPIVPSMLAELNLG